jgi:hypothetical protein
MPALERRLVDSMNGETQGLDAAQVIARIRQGLKPKLQLRRTDTPVAGVGLRDDFGRDLTTLHTDWDVYHVSAPSSRRGVGPLVDFVKRALRVVLKPVLLRQVSYNQANSRLVQDLVTDTARLRQAQAVAVAAIEARLAEIVRRQEELALALDRLKAGPAGSPAAEAGPDQWRAYAAHLDGVTPLVELEHGGGAFLEFLSTAGGKATGIGAAPAEVARCRAKGLEVIESRLEDVLARVPDDSLGGLFTARFCAPGPARDVLAFAQLCHRKLHSGGVVVFETVTGDAPPGSGTPVPARALGFLLDALGFAPAPPGAAAVTGAGRVGVVARKA